MILANGPVIGPAHIRFEGPARGGIATHAGTGDRNLARHCVASLRATEKRILMDALRAGQSRAEVAEHLGISPRTLRYKLAQLRSAGIDVPAAG